jgi:hypothetical protein
MLHATGSQRTAPRMICGTFTRAESTQPIFLKSTTVRDFISPQQARWSMTDIGLCGEAKLSRGNVGVARSAAGATESVGGPIFTSVVLPVAD